MTTPPGTAGQPANRDAETHADLVAYGLTGSVGDHFTRITNIDPGLVPGRVVRVDGISTVVHTGSGDIRAVTTFARFAGPTETEPHPEPRPEPGLASQHDAEPEIEPAQPTVGDWVLVRTGDNIEPDSLELVLPRTSLLVRKRVMRGKDQGDDQALAANVDTVFIVQAATYFNAARLERELALVWGSGSVPVVVLTKIDLLGADGHGETGGLARIAGAARAVAPGASVFTVSGVTGEGAELLHGFTAAGKTVVLIGASGVGKSTLVNRLMGEEVMDTGEIRESDDRGRHTTTTRQLLPMPGGGVLIDSPGIRTIGLVSGSEEALDRTFSEIGEYLGKCKFRNCAHRGEPGCAIAEAIADGSLLESRLASYRRMLSELQHEQTRNDPATQTDRQRRMRIVARDARQRTRLEKRSENE